MAIKIKHKDPKSTDFGPNDIVINIKEGTIFYKSEKGLFKIQGDQLNTTTDIIKFESDISASKGFFTTPGIGTMKLGVGPERNKFTIGPSPTIEVTGHILPSSTAAPSYDLGSPKRRRNIYTRKCNRLKSRKINNIRKIKYRINR